MEPAPSYDRGFVDELALSFCRRYGLEDWEDFRQDVHLHLIENDCARLRGFDGRCNLKTFLFQIIHRLAIDRLVRKKGKWRPSAAANRLGPAATELEVLISRERYQLNEAIQVMSTRGAYGLSEGELRNLAGQLPSRVFGRQESADGLEAIPDLATPGRASDEERREAETALDKLRQAMEELDPVDQLIVKMRFWEGMKVVRIGEILGLGKRPHARVARILARLRSELHARGLEAADVRELLCDKELRSPEVVADVVPPKKEGRSV